MLKLIPLLFFIVSLSYLLQTERWIKLVREMIDNPHRIFYPCLMFLAFGLYLVLRYNRWGNIHQIFVALIGWIFVIKTSAFLVFPQLLDKYKSWSDASLKNSFRVIGAFFFVLCLYLFFTAPQISPYSRIF